MMRNDALYFYGDWKQTSNDVTEDRGNMGIEAEGRNRRIQESRYVDARMSRLPHQAPRSGRLPIDLLPKYFTHKRGTTASRASRVAYHGSEETAIRPLIGPRRSSLNITVWNGTKLSRLIR